MKKPILTLRILYLLLLIFPNCGIMATSVISSATTFTADTAPVYQSMSNYPIIGLMIEVDGPGDDLLVTALSIDPSLCTNFSMDIQQVKVFYTGNDSTFHASGLFWSGLQVDQPLNGIQALHSGKNYFWICFSITNYAVTGDTVDVICNSFTINYNAGNYIPEVTSPPGYRIVAPYLVIPRNISGRLLYANVQQSSLANVMVLLSDGYTQQQVYTSANGSFMFVNLPPSTYYITVVCNKVWGGVNAVDALAILRHFVGTTPLTGMPLMAADVDANGYVNSSDGFQILRRFTGLISSFPAGDWVFENVEVVIDGTHNVTRNIKGLCTGDVYVTYIPY